MKIKALTSFSGLFTMTVGETTECKDDYIATDLIKAGYAVEVKNSTAKTEEKPKRARNENK